MKERIRKGLEHWSELAELAGLPNDGWEPQLLTTRTDAKADRVVILLRHRSLAAVVCKRTFKDLEAMARGIVAQDLAAKAMSSSSNLGVPRILCALPDRGSVLMEAVEGQTLLEICLSRAKVDFGIADIGRAGQWLDAFHRSRELKVTKFDSSSMIHHFEQIRQDLETGRRQVASKAQFLRCLDAVVELGRSAHRIPTISAILHGDLTATNLILGPQSVWGIDMAGTVVTGPGFRPVGYDFARMLVYLVEKLPISKNHEVVPAEIFSSFFEGYRVVSSADGTVPFLIPARLVLDWLSLPPANTSMNLRQFLRFRRIKRMAQAITLAS